MIQRLALLTNPKGRHNAKAGLGRISAIAAAAGIPHEIAAEPVAIRAALQRLATAQPDVLIVNGGDGTVDLVVDALRTASPFTKSPILVLLPGGTTNMIHRDVGMKARPARALRQLLALPRITANAQRQPLVAVGAAATATGFFLCAGAIPRAILATRQRLHRRNLGGPFSEILVICLALLRLKFRRTLDRDPILRPTALHWQAAGQSHDEPHIFVAASSLRSLLLGIKTQAAPDWIGLLTMAADRTLRHDAMPTLTLDADEPWMMDGEDMPAGRYTVQLGPPLDFYTDRAAS